jgi:N-acetyl-anhydromuramyl-L-alanine amidase AmpD
MRDIDYIVIHCAATKPSMDVPIERVKKWHLDRGWSDIGYHYYITRDGEIHKGRKLSTIGAHVRGYNKNSIGICYEGGINESGEPEDNRTKVQKKSLLKVVQILKFVFSNAIVQGHRDFPNVNKACPSFDAKNEYKEI